MVYKYKRKTNQAQWSEDSLRFAIADCNSGIPVKTTARKYGLPYATLYRHWKKGSSTAQLERFRKIFNEQQEGELQTYLQEMGKIVYGLTREAFKSLVFSYAKSNNLAYPPSWDKNEKAGDDWLTAFMRRNPQIILRVPEATSIGRVEGFKEQTEKYTETTPGPSAASPSTYFSPKKIRPLPTAGTSKRKTQKSEALTTKINAKITKNIKKDRNIKLNTTTKKNAETTKNKKFEDEAKANDEEKFMCYFCGEDYIEINKKPVDDWIQCNSCKQWSHEKCTAYEGRSLFLCDVCTD